jgi:acyl carrier protein
MKNFLSLFAEQFEETDTALISAKTKFRDLEEWTSMHALLVLAMIDESYEIVLPADELETCETIEDIFMAIQKLKTNS